MFKNYLPLYRYSPYELENLNKYARYKEFVIDVPKRENIPKIIGKPMSHQILIANLMKGFTPINSLLLVHEMGTGKTCTAITAIEENLNDIKYGMTKALILNKGKAIMNNFIYELTNKCTKKYSMDNERLSKKLWSKYYNFDTFELFVKKIKVLTDTQIINRYNNIFIVIDEIHNILNEQSEIYTQIDRFLKLLPNKKVLLMTGTPVRDSPSDIVPIMNLILEDKNKLSRKDFLDLYYNENGDLNSDFKKIISGRVSYMKTSIPEIKINHCGQLLGNLKKFKIVKTIMSDFQSKIYVQAFNSDKRASGGVYVNSRQVTRLVFPDGSYGKIGFDKYIIMRKNKPFLTKNFKDFLTKNGNSQESILKTLAEISARYAYIIEKTIEADKNKEKTIIYDDLVKGSGLIVLKALMDFLNFKKSALITSETTTTSEIQKIQSEFNSSVTGEKISTILGSRVIAEGFTFLDVSHEHIATHWNNTETSQVIARGIRMGSHRNLLAINPSAVVNVYRHCTLTNDINYEKCIDYIMTYKSETKALEIDKVLKAIKEVSITCSVFQNRNDNVCIYSKTNLPVKYCSISGVNLNTETIQILQLYFKNIKYKHIFDISKDLNIDIAILVRYLEFFINNKILIKNYKGIKCRLNEKNNFYFLIENVLFENEIRLSWYSDQIKPYVTMSKDDAYLNSLNLIIDNKSAKSIQRLIELAVTVKFCNIVSKNPSKVEEILTRYRSFWMYNDEKAFVWFANSAEKSDIMCLEKPFGIYPWTEWNKCSKSGKDFLKEAKRKLESTFKKQLIDTNISFYGLLNPISNEFCIKNVENLDLNTDRRKIKSGKRCKNYNKTELINLINTMKINISNIENKNRETICEDLQKWFAKHNLLIDDTSCGVQTKIKM